MSWNLEEYKVYYNFDVVGTFEEPITADDVKAIARDLGLKRLKVESAEGEELEAYDFPQSGDITIYQVNKAG
jgi:hypothetical protein